MNKPVLAFKSAFKVGQHTISDKAPPFIIAELSGNHKGDISQALELISKAASTGVHAIKIQTYKPDTITLDHDGEGFYLKDGLWQGRTLFDLYEEAHTPWEWHQALFDEAKKLNIPIFSSPFDTTAVDLLEDLNCPAYKIASFEITDINLIQYAASTGKPIIMSTGMANRDEIDEAVNTIYEAGGRELAILHCVSGYPTPIGDSNLLTISDLKQRYTCPVGLSDHTQSNITAITATALGANLIEKHFKLSNSEDCVDADFSITPEEFTALVKDTHQAWSALGKINYQLKTSEAENQKFRRSLYASAPIKKGERFTRSNIKSVRPGYGMHPRYLNQILGTCASQDIEFGTPLGFEHLTQEIKS